MQLKITVSPLVAGVALVAAAPYLVPTSEVSTRELRLCTCLLLIPALWTPVMVFRALIEVRQQSYAINFLLILQTLLSTALLAAAAWAGWGLVGQGAAMAIASVPLMVVLLSHGLREFRDVFTAQPTEAALAQVRSLSLPTFVFSLTGRVALYTDNILIAWMLGAPAVVPFFLTHSGWRKWFKCRYRESGIMQPGRG